MSCYHPLPAYRERGKEGASVKIGHNPQGKGDKLELPCGRCIGCKLDHSQSWSVRLMHEAQLYNCNLFLTLDYAPEHLPPSLSLEYRDFQGFMKRLRKEVPGADRIEDGSRPIRFFCSGEYGEARGRPHWHVILFNCRFGDEVRFCNDTYRSARAEDLWRRGNVVIGAVTAASAAYVAGYTLNKVYGRYGEEYYEDVVDLSTGEVTSRRPPFCTMSRRPGIGARWYQKFGQDLFPHDFAVDGDGKKRKVPTYYWRRFQDGGDPLVAEEIAHRRFLRAMEVDRSENTEARRSVREEVALARTRMFSPRNSL